MTLEAAASELDLTVDQVRRFCKSGALDAKKLPDENHRRALRWLINPNDVEQWKARGELPEAEQIPPGFTWTVPDCREALQRGELRSMDAEDIREWVRRERSKAIRAWNAAKDGSYLASDA